MSGEAKRKALAKLMADAETRYFKQGHCLNCGAPLSGVTGPKDVDPGSIMVCAYCSHIMEWTGDRLAELSDRAMRDIAGDPAVMAVVEATALFRVAQRPARCAGCGASNPYGKIRCTTCGKPLVFPAGGPR
jgi:ribosomal protein S27E